MKCAEVRELLPAYVDDRDSTLAVRRHISRCADCRRELEEYAQLRAEMTDLASSVAPPPPGLRSALIAIPSTDRRVEKVVTHLARNRRAYAGGLAMAVMGAAGAAVWRSRRMRPAAA